MTSRICSSSMRRSSLLAAVNPALTIAAQALRVAEHIRTADLSAFDIFTPLRGFGATKNVNPI